jgi:hypothetical protein
VISNATTVCSSSSSGISTSHDNNTSFTCSISSITGSIVKYTQLSNNQVAAYTSTFTQLYSHVQ